MMRCDVTDGACPYSSLSIEPMTGRSIEGSAAKRLYWLVLYDDPDGASSLVAN